MRRGDDGDYGNNETKNRTRRTERNNENKFLNVLYKYTNLKYGNSEWDIEGKEEKTN